MAYRLRSAGCTAHSSAPERISTTGIAFLLKLSRTHSSGGVLVSAVYSLDLTDHPPWSGLPAEAGLPPSYQQATCAHHALAWACKSCACSVRAAGDRNERECAIKQRALHAARAPRVHCMRRAPREQAARCAGALLRCALVAHMPQRANVAHAVPHERCGLQPRSATASAAQHCCCATCANAFLHAARHRRGKVRTAAGSVGNSPASSINAQCLRLQGTQLAQCTSS